MNITHILLLVAGAFIAYNLIVLVYAFMTYKTGLSRLVFVAKYAPWLGISEGMSKFVYSGAFT
jgi:hypothetical protein